MANKTFTLIIGLLLCSLDVFSSDTTIIRTHDHVDMTWYGNYDKIGVFPDGSETYRKIYLHYTMGCPSSGCAPYDYTTKIEVLHNTGEIDSTLQQTPAFTVNGVGVDTLMIADTSYIYYWDTLTSMLDSIISIPLEVIYFDTTQPTIPIDTLYYFPAGFYNMIFDSIGNIIDSIYVNPTGLLINSTNNWYSYFDVIEKYEIARVITPYGGNIPSNYAFKHIFDITDFASILQDSVKIRAHYSGWGNGWSATLDFEFIEGIPPRNVNSIQNVYSGNYSYVNSTDFETNKLNSKNLWIYPNTTQAMIKMTTTGHSFDNNINAAEFNIIDYKLNIDGQLTHIQQNWNDKCGENPIYPYYENPNGGYIHTWILDRANWCPGLRAKTFDHEITPYINSSDSVEINVDFTSFSWSPHPGTSCPIQQGGICYNNGAGQTPLYIIECQLFQYEASNFNNSAEITDIIKPSSKDEYSRFNPTCGKPLIEIRNYGATTLNTLEIEYGIIGGSLHTYNWSGSLEFLETQEVELPLLTNWHGTKDIFYVKLNNPNGQADDYDVNNYMETVFEHVPQYQNKFAVWTTINNGVISSWTNESETSWEFFKDDGSLHAASQQMFLGIVPQNQYRDTIDFESGCYTFKVTDLGENGLDYGYNNDGVGSIKFRNVPGTTFKDFHPDFGSNIIHNFRVGSILSNENIIQDFIIYPIPAKDEIIISGDLIKYNILTIVDNSGRFVKELNSLSGSQIKVDISNLSRGVYFITSHDNSVIRKFVKQ